MPPPTVARAEAVAPSVPASDLLFGTPSGSPIAAAALPLLQLLARLRTTAHQPDPADLYERTLRELRTFEQKVRDAGVPAEQVRAAHYALCVSIDEVVVNTPWGGASDWAKRRLAVALHQDTTEGGRFFQLLARLRQTPAQFMPVIEIMYLCLSLGVMGRYRNAPRDAEELDRVRAETCALIVGQQTLAGQELSPRWQGVAAPYARTRGGLPVWVVYAAALAMCGGLFLWVTTALNAASDDQYARMLAAPPASMPQISRAVVVQPPPPPPAPPEPDVLDRLRAALKADIDSGRCQRGRDSRDADRAGRQPQRLRRRPCRAAAGDGRRVRADRRGAETSPAACR